MAKGGRNSAPLPDVVTLLPPPAGLSAWVRALTGERALTVEQARGLVLLELADWREAHAAGVAQLPGAMSVQLTVRAVAEWTGAPEPSVRRAMGEAVNKGLLERVGPGMFEAIVPVEWPDEGPGWERRDDGAVVTWK